MKENLIEKSLYSHKSARLEASKPRAFFLFGQCSDNVRIMPINYYLLSPVRYRRDNFLKSQMAAQKGKVLQEVSEKPCFFAFYVAPLPPMSFYSIIRDIKIYNAISSTTCFETKTFVIQNKN